MAFTFRAIFRWKKTKTSPPTSAPEPKPTPWVRPAFLPFATLEALCRYCDRLPRRGTGIHRSKTEGMDCALCQDTEEHERPIRLPCCGQLVGDVCVQVWFLIRAKAFDYEDVSESHGKCPLCRFQLLHSSYQEHLNPPLLLDSGVDRYGSSVPVNDNIESHNSDEEYHAGGYYALDGLYSGSVEDDDDIEETESEWDPEQSSDTTSISSYESLPDESEWMRFVRDMPPELRNFYF